MSEAVLALKGVKRTFRQGGSRIEVLRGVALKLVPGEIVALIGPSGAGKSTLLHVAGLLETPDDGEILIDGKPCGRLTDGERTAIRRRRLGFVYQFHHLLPEFSALENVVLPQLVAGRDKGESTRRAHALLERLGLAQRASHRPARLSGGEQQRVAFARALANEPAVLLADEPTGNLDPETADVVFDAMIEVARAGRVAALVATHNPELARRMDRILRLGNGIVEPA
jgi:lipoprotein-releasing system ATP-binding protein